MEAYNPIIAAFINSVLVLLIVQVLKNWIPKMKENAPALIPIMAGAVGPGVAAAQNALFSWLGIPIDLSLITAIFTGGTAVAMNQVGKQVQKAGAESAPQAAAQPAPTKASGRISLGCLLILLLSAGAFCLTGCSTLGLGGGTSFDKMTPDEKGRVIVGGFQDASGALFDAGKVFIIAQPQYISHWKLAVVPGFDLTNKLLADLEVQGASGKEITAQMVVANLQTRVTDILTIYTQWGTIAVGSKEKATPEQIALLIATGLQGGSVLVDQILAASSGSIPTWETIIAKNKLLQAKIDAEK